MQPRDFVIGSDKGANAYASTKSRVLDSGGSSRSKSKAKSASGASEKRPKTPTIERLQRSKSKSRNIISGKFELDIGSSSDNGSEADEPYEVHIYDAHSNQGVEKAVRERHGRESERTKHKYKLEMQRKLSRDSSRSRSRSYSRGRSINRVGGVDRDKTLSPEWQRTPSVVSRVHSTKSKPHRHEHYHHRSKSPHGVRSVPKARRRIERSPSPEHSKAAPRQTSTSRAESLSRSKSNDVKHGRNKARDEAIIAQLRVEKGVNASTKNKKIELEKHTDAQEKISHSMSRDDTFGSEVRNYLSSDSKQRPRSRAGSKTPSRAKSTVSKNLYADIKAGDKRDSGTSFKYEEYDLNKLSKLEQRQLRDRSRAKSTSSRLAARERELRNLEDKSHEIKEKDKLERIKRLKEREREKEKLHKVEKLKLNKDVMSDAEQSESDYSRDDNTKAKLKKKLRKMKHLTEDANEKGVISSMVSAVSKYLNLTTDEEKSDDESEEEKKLEESDSEIELSKKKRRAASSNSRTSNRSDDGNFDDDARKKLLEERKRQLRRKKLAQGELLQKEGHSRSKPHHEHSDSSEADSESADEAQDDEQETFNLDRYAEREIARRRELKKARELKEQARLRAEAVRKDKARELKMFRKMADDKRSLEKRQSILEERLKKQKEKELLLKIQKEEEKLKSMEKEEALKRKLIKEKQRVKKFQKAVYGNGGDAGERYLSDQGDYILGGDDDSMDDVEPSRSVSKARSKISKSRPTSTASKRQSESDEDDKPNLSHREKEMRLIEKAEKLKKKLGLENGANITAKSNRPKKVEPVVEAATETEEERLKRYIDEKKQLLKQRKEQKLRELEVKDARERVRAASRTSRSLGSIKKSSDGEEDNRGSSRASRQPARRQPPSDPRSASKSRSLKHIRS